MYCRYCGEYFSKRFAANVVALVCVAMSARKLTLTALQMRLLVYSRQISIVVISRPPPVLRCITHVTGSCKGANCLLLQVSSYGLLARLGIYSRRPQPYGTFEQTGKCAVLDSESFPTWEFGFVSAYVFGLSGNRLDSLVKTLPITSMAHGDRSSLLLADQPCRSHQ